MRSFWALVIVSVLLTACSATPDATTESVNDRVNLTPTPTQTRPTPTPTLEQRMSGPGQKPDYRGDIDVRDLYKGIDKYIDWKLTYAGHVLNIEGNSDGTWLQLTVQYGASQFDTEVIDFIYPSSVSMDNIYEDSYVTVWGRPYKMYTGMNALGGEIDQPLLVGDYISE